LRATTVPRQLLVGEYGLAASAALEPFDAPRLPFTKTDPDDRPQ
jgi:hypothetical protein